jgi:hypothetical protein
MPIRNDKRKMLSVLIDDLIELHTLHGDMPVHLSINSPKQRVKATATNVKTTVVGGGLKELSISNI